MVISFLGTFANETTKNLNLTIMQQRLITCLFILLPLTALAQKVNIDSLYNILDEAIANSPQYVAQRRASIAKLENELANAGSDKERYDLSYQLYDEYKAFVNDSAIYYLQKCITLADQTDNTQQANYCRAKLAFQCSNTGLYNEALYCLNNINSDKLDRQSLGFYYKACNHVYSELAFYGKIEGMNNGFSEKASEYETLMLEVLPTNGRDYLQRMEQTCMAQGRQEESMRYNDQWMEKVEKGSHPYALTAFYRYLEYQSRGDTLEMTHWLTESAIADVRNAVMDQGSMWELANLLMKLGDIDRAYRYIAFANDCASRFGTRLRSWQISPVVTIIGKQYHAHLEQEQLRTRLFIGALCLLALLILASLIYVSRQRRKLAVAHKRLHESNKILSEVNQQLQQSNQQLLQLNQQLTSVNAQLSESNHVKEEYVGRFLRQCSLYIDKHDAMRRKVNKMVKNHEYEELYKLTRSPESQEKELEELYVNFDDAFLHLFPNFVDDFNALLKPEEQMVPETGNRLSTGLRIFALIRLGITDSSKIADFLHYSVNTIYNYRARIKNGAIANREHFEEMVRRL